MALSINYEVYTNDISNKIKGIIFNGWLIDINRSDGKNLLYLLQKNGYKARIDLDEAKETNNSSQR
ncbi:MAG TPA: hypothetical protein DG753_04905 [Clostridium sp.]|nr:hypothetical protein [Clostridium sp.]